MQKLQNPGGVVSWFSDTEAAYLLKTTPGWTILETVADDAVVDPARGEKPQLPVKQAPIVEAPVSAPAPDPSLDPAPTAPEDVVPVPEPKPKKPKK